jgi:hypothetical protein
MGRIHKEYLEGEVITCPCSTHLTTHESIISTQFRGQHGTCYLFHNVVNVYYGDKEEKRMTTGVHLIRNVYCIDCDAYLGWTYEKAYEASQKYKEGKYILEMGLCL